MADRVSRNEYYASRKKYYDSQRELNQRRYNDRVAANKLNRAEKERLEAERERSNRRAFVSKTKNNTLSFLGSRVMIVVIALLMIAPMFNISEPFNPGIMDDFDSYREFSPQALTLTGVLDILEDSQSNMKETPYTIIKSFLTEFNSVPVLGPLVGVFTFVLDAIQQSFVWIELFFRLIFGIY